MKRLDEAATFRLTVGARRVMHPAELADWVVIEAGAATGTYAAKYKSSVNQLNSRPGIGLVAEELKDIHDGYFSEAT